MSKLNRAVVLDPDSSRRAAIARQISGGMFHVEPYESIRELDQYWSEYSIIMVYDHEKNVCDVISKMKEKGGFEPVIAYSQMPKVENVVNAILEGALDYMEWPFQHDQLVAHFEIVGRRFDDLGESRCAANQAKHLVERLSKRELEVLSLLAGGRTNNAIASEMDISSRTVEVHRANMMAKLGKKHVAEAVQAAFDAEIVIPRNARGRPLKRRAA